MKPFLTTVLLRLARCDALESNPESDPPDGEFREPSGAYRSEWRTVVRTHRGRQTKLTEGGIEDPKTRCTCRSSGSSNPSQRRRSCDPQRRNPRALLPPSWNSIAAGES